jgi:hypothetical protein
MMQYMKVEIQLDYVTAQGCILKIYRYPSLSNDDAKAFVRIHMAKQIVSAE